MSSLIIVGGVALVLGMLAIGIPIYLTLIAAASSLLLFGGFSLAGIGQHVLDHLNSPALVAVPFFLLAAVLMRGGGVARALLDAAMTWIGWLPGGLALAGVVATAIFAAINGSSVATALAMGTLLVPAMTERGYERKFAMGLTAASATLGILIPPSLPMILIGLIAEESIPRLFIAGIVPGLLQAVLFCLYIVLAAKRAGGTSTPFSLGRELVRINARALPAMLIPLVVLGGLYGGFVTLTEAAVLGAVVSLLVVVFIYRTERLSSLPRILVEAVERTAVIVVIVVGATLLSAWIIKSGTPQILTKMVVRSGIAGWQFLLVVNALLLLMGTVLEGVSIILIVIPILMPVVRELGIDPAHFAVVTVMNIELALLSPPIGLNLFVMANVSNRPVSEVLRGTLPFFGLMLLLLLLVTYVPALSTALPNALLGPQH